MAKPKIGDTRGWNERDQTGYKWEKTIHGERWVQYYKGKPTKSLGGPTGFVDVFSAPRHIGNFAKSLDIRDRVESEKIKPLQELTDNDRVGYLINDLIENAANEEEKNEYLQFKEIHDASLQTKLILAETGAGSTNIIPESGEIDYSKAENFSMARHMQRNAVVNDNNEDGDSTTENPNNTDLTQAVTGSDGSEPSNEISDADRELGSTPWARKGLMDSPKLANQATWRLLEEEGYDLRGVQDKDRLAADYRLGRLNKTDKGLWYENKFLRNK
tara:strand:+ start:41 stop:859 length:819 start_codon:yes stop_codon:yes gene_type:complete